MIRRVTLFLLALGFGALTVRGQGADDEAHLRRRIRALSDEIQRRADRLPAAHNLAPRAEVRMHDVGDLIAPRPETSGGMIDLLPSKFAIPKVEQSEPSSFVEVDSLIEVVRQTIEPESWETVENADIEYVRNTLVVTNIPRVHRKVAALFDTLRRLAHRRLRVRFVALRVLQSDRALLAGRPRALTATEAQSLLSREPLGVVETVCHDNQRTSRRSGRNVTYLQDYEVKIAQEAHIGDPKRWQAFSGLAVELQPHLDERGKGVRLDCELTLTFLTEPIRRIDTQHGPLELPELAMTRVRTSTWVPLGKVCVVGGSMGGQNPCLFLVRVDRVR